jgi:hypothetical protein
MPNDAPRLSKSRFTAGLQCHKYLWLKVHEPEAPELEADEVLQDRFDQGIRVGELARERFPGGRLIDLPYYAARERVAATRKAVDDGVPAVFEATFVEDGTFVAVDVLERLGDGFRLIEVKSTRSAKEEHVPDAAVQVYVARKAGIDVRAAEILHLNPEHRAPDLGDLFARTDVTDAVEALQPDIPAEIARQRAMLAGSMPDVAVGAHCFAPYACPFFDRCWPGDADHIRHLYGVGAVKTVAYLERGIHRFGDLPPGEKLSSPARRQLRALAEDRVVVEPGLAEALEAFEPPIGFLDFETILRAIPPWPGTGPYETIPVQFSYHEESVPGEFRHEEYLADGPGDPRPDLARRLVEVTANVDRVAMYTGFERSRIRSLRDAVPSLAAELEALDGKLVDLKPVVSTYVYHPGFGGSFSIKDVLEPLAPDCSYDRLAVNDGMVASVRIARMLLTGDEMDPAERERMRGELLEYCKLDTWAMVRLLQRLRELAAR